VFAAPLWQNMLWFGLVKKLSNLRAMVAEIWPGNRVAKVAVKPLPTVIKALSIRRLQEFGWLA
jgi:hypothetical protein